MAHVSVLRFRVSNKASTTMAEDMKTSWWEMEVKQLSSTSQITEALDEFMQGRKLISFDVTPITCKQNRDRERDDTVDVLYTIFWEEDIDFQEKEQMRKSKYSALEMANDKIIEQANVIQQMKTQQSTKERHIPDFSIPTQMPQTSWQKQPNGYETHMGMQNMSFGQGFGMGNQNMYNNNR